MIYKNSLFISRELGSIITDNFFSGMSTRENNSFNKWIVVVEMGLRKLKIVVFNI